MAEFLRSVIQQDVALTASAQTNLINLPVNPISHLLLTIKSNNNTGTLSNYRFLSNYASFVTNFEVVFKGQAVMSGSLTDLMILNALLTGYMPYQHRAVNTDNDVRSACFMLSFSRVPYWAQEAFPATSSGELQFRLTAGAAPAGMDTFNMQLETVELLGATPARFVKYTAFTGTQASTGLLDVDIPRGNPLLGVMLFGTTVQTTTSGVNTIESVQLKVDNVEKYYSKANWETLHGEIERRVMGAGLGLQGHFHHGITSAGAADFDTDDPELRSELLESYAYLDLDPLKDSAYALATEGRGRIFLRVEYGDTAAMRYMPVELVQLAGAAA